MTTITRQVTIDAPAAEVWALLADFGNIYRFNPTVRTSHSTNELHGVGAARHCDLGRGSSIEEVIAEWTEGVSMTVHIVGGTKTPPFKGHPEARLFVEPLGDRSTVSGSLSYELKGGPLGRLMDAVMVRSRFETAWTGVLAGLKKHAESGTEIDSLADIDASSVAHV